MSQPVSTGSTAVQDNISMLKNKMGVKYFKWNNSDIGLNYCSQLWWFIPFIIFVSFCSVKHVAEWLWNDITIFKGNTTVSHRDDGSIYKNNYRRNYRRIKNEILSYKKIYSDKINLK